MKVINGFANFVKNGRKAAFIVPVILGFLFSASAQFIETGGVFEPYDVTFLLKGIFYSLLFVVLFLAFERGVMSFPRNQANNKIKKRINVLPIKFIAPSWQGMKKYIVVIVLCWVPTYLFLFPGVMLGDTALQIEQYLSSPIIYDWHPFLETKIFGRFFTFGGISNPMLGVGIFIALQMIVAAGVTAYACYYVQRIVKFRYAGYVAAVLLAIYPMAPLSYMTMNKDYLFAICFMLFSILYCEVWRTHGKLLKQPSFLVAFITVALLAMYTKKTGPYLIPAALVLTVFMSSKKSLRLLTACLGIGLFIFAKVFMPLAVFPNISVAEGPKQEMLAIPEQQLARVVKDSPEEFSEEERQIINDVVVAGFDGIAEKYDNYLVDPIKGTYVPNERSIGAFLKLWAKKGLEHPWEYALAEIGLQSGWITFTGNTTGKDAYVYASPTDSSSSNTLSTIITWPEASKASLIWASWYNSLSNTPTLNLLMYVCVWASIIPFAIIFFIWRRAKHVMNALVCQSPLLLSMGMLLLCPTSYHSRYMFPMMLTAPIFIAVLSKIQIKGENRHQRKQPLKPH